MAEWAWIIYTILEVLVAVACCLGNVLVVCAVCVCDRGSLRDPTCCFLGSLAVADFLVGVAAVPLAVLLDGWVYLTPDLCLILSCVVLVLTEASVLSLLAIAVDRYLRVHTPLRYKDLVSQRKLMVAVILCWVISCLLGFAPLYVRNYGSLGFLHTTPSTSYSRAPPSLTTTPNTSYSSPFPQCTFLSVVSLPFMVYFNFLACVLAPLLVMTLLYARLFWCLQSRLRDSLPQARASLLRERRLAGSLALVLLLFAGCWIPLHLMNCALLMRGPEAVPKEGLYAGILLSHVNSALNPLVYAYRIPKIQQAYHQIWTWCVQGAGCCCREERGDTSLTGSRANRNTVYVSGARPTP